MSATPIKIVDNIPKLQMETNYEQSYIPLSEKGVLTTIVLPRMMGIETKTSNYFKEASATLNIENSLVQDAKHAVTLLKGSTYKIQGTDFRRNYIRIYVPPGQTPPVTITQSAVFSGNTFTCDIYSFCPMRWDFIPGTGYDYLINLMQAWI